MIFFLSTKRMRRGKELGNLVLGTLDRRALKLNIVCIYKMTLKMTTID